MSQGLLEPSYTECGLSLFSVFVCVPDRIIDSSSGVFVLVVLIKKLIRASEITIALHGCCANSLD